MEKTLDMAEVTLAAYELYQDPMNQELRAKVNDIVGKMVILSYVPLREKQAAVVKTAILLEERDKRPDEIAMQVELFFTLGVFDTYTNIKVDTDFYKIFSPEFLDAIVHCKIWDEIMDHCKYDIQSFRQLLDSTLNWRNVYTMVEEFGSIDMAHVDALVQEVREAREALGDENVKLLKRMADFNRPGAENFADLVGASLMSTIDKVSDEALADWHKKQDMVVDLDAVLGANTLNHIEEEIVKYFKEDEASEVSKEEIQDVYAYLKNKNQAEINKIDADISVETKSTLEQGITSQMIKLLSKKKALDRKYQQQEELIKLADTILSIDGQSYDNIKNILEQYSVEQQIDKSEK